MSSFYALLCAILNILFKLPDCSAYDVKNATIVLSILIRNKEHTLPYFLTLLEDLNYPKDRISLFIRSDHNEDGTISILNTWLDKNKQLYHSSDIFIDSETRSYPDEVYQSDWSDNHFNAIINMKEEALNYARRIWADYILYLDADVFLTNYDVLYLILLEHKFISSPMLKSLGTYSNYWCGMTDNYWYKRTDEYIPILERKNIGCFSVPMVHSFVLIDLRKALSDKLTFRPDNLINYDGPKDDIITFAMSAKNFGIEMHICNQQIFGFIPPPLNEGEHASKDLLQLTAIKLEVLVENPPLPVSSPLLKYVPDLAAKDKLGFNEIYLINLYRRYDRRIRMYRCFDELGLSVHYFEGVDGLQINDSYLQKLEIKQLEGYEDPWSKRDMTFGEIGCFLSHYFIWQDIINKKYDQVLIFEDDIRFEPYFREKVTYMMNQIKKLHLEWDLIYLGRKKLRHSDEPWVTGSDILVHVDYSYWTLCYIISQSGAAKLLQGQPLSKIVPVDEYIPIMFDKHPEEKWKTKFSRRNLKAFSSAPLLVYPTHYTGEKGYISDTEVSHVIQRSLDVDDAINMEFVDKGLSVEVGVNPLFKDEL